jgi:hypothetical protein
LKKAVFGYFFSASAKKVRERNNLNVLFGIAPKRNQKSLALGKITYPSSI